MRSLFLYLLAFFCGTMYSQNNARLLSISGKMFKVYVDDKAVNQSAQASVLLENLTDDTLSVKIEFENSSKNNATLYLLDKGITVSGKEFDYTVDVIKNNVSIEFTGIYDITPLPDPIVPGKIKIDTSLNYRNKLLGHFCELKEGSPVYFNNFPKDGNCINAMPGEYLTYVNLLVQHVKSAEDKYAIVENVCKNNCLSVDELGTLLTYVDYELDKLKLLKLTYFNLVDLQNQDKLSKNFKLESSLKELNDFLKNSADYKVRSANACVKASPDAEVNTLAENMTAYSSDGQRLAALKKVVGNYCFSLKQVIAVLQNFLHDREKLDAAKLLYFNCVERTNFTIVSNVFSYSQTAGELKDFVAKQTH